MWMVCSQCHWLVWSLVLCFQMSSLLLRFPHPWRGRGSVQEQRILPTPSCFSGIAHLNCHYFTNILVRICSGRYALPRHLICKQFGNALRKRNLGSTRSFVECLWEFTLLSLRFLSCCFCQRSVRIEHGPWDHSFFLGGGRGSEGHGDKAQLNKINLEQRKKVTAELP